MFSGSVLAIPVSIITSWKELKRAEKKQACLEGLKCLVKKSAIGLSIELQFL